MMPLTVVPLCVLDGQDLEYLFGVLVVAVLDVDVALKVLAVEAVHDHQDAFERVADERDVRQPLEVRRYRVQRNEKARKEEYRDATNRSQKYRFLRRRRKNIM